MPDHRFPEAKPPSGLNSGAQNLIKLDQKPGFSSLVKPVQEPWSHPWYKDTQSSHQPGVSSLLKPLTLHAEPLAPLRQRDEHALEEIFDDIQVGEILADVCLRLRQLYPEPCWEDDPFDFLQGYV